MTEVEAFSLILEFISSIRKSVSSSFQGNVRRHRSTIEPFKRSLGQALSFLRALSGPNFLKQTSSLSVKRKAHSLLKSLFKRYYKNDKLRVQVATASSTGYFSILRAVMVLLNKISDPNTIELNVEGHDDCYQTYYSRTMPSMGPGARDNWPGYKQERRNCPANHAFTLIDILVKRSWQFICWDIYHSDLNFTMGSIFLPERENEIIIEALQKTFGSFRRRSLPQRAKASRQRRDTYAQMRVEAIELCRNKDLTYGAIAKKVGTTATTVRSWCLKEGLRTARTYKPEPPRKYLPEPPIRHRKRAKKPSTRAKKPKYEWKFCPHCQNKLEPTWKCCPFCGSCRNR